MFNNNHGSSHKSKEIVCYNCNEKGHFSRNCPKPQKKERCVHCQRTNHKSADCTLRSRNADSRNQNINRIAESEDTYQDVIKAIYVNGRKLTAFMDSGSPTSLMRKSCANNFGSLLQECSKSLRGFAGGKYRATKKLFTHVEIDDQRFEVELFVVEDEDIPENVLVGRDVICKKGNRFVIEEEHCRVESTNPPRVTCIVQPLQQDDLQTILTANKTCFAANIAELGKCSVAKMRIKLKNDEPINMKPYRIPFAKREIVEDIVQELLNFQIIRPSNSRYASPVVLVAKKNGEHRLCVDYRCLNKITVRTPFPMPILEEQFAQLAGNTYFTSLDLRMGYHQIEMEEESKQFTAFITTDGHFEYNRMPFGLVNAPAVFQRVMNANVSEINSGEILAYLDDVILPSKTIQEGMERLEKFLNVLARFGLTLRLDKCKFFETEIEHLGHIVNEGGIKPGRQKVSAIRNFKVPENVTEVRRFLGLTGFFRKFVPDYSIITKPITKLLNKTESEHFEWTPLQQQAFETMLSLLTDAPLLALYDATKYHEVHTDACALGLAGVLLQSADDKNWQPVMYFSRHCTPPEQKYHSYELEVLAVVETLERFRLYLLGKPFRIITDCSAIAQTKDQRELKPRIARWWLRMQEFNFEVVHRPGSRLAHVDAMSRAPVGSAQPIEPTGYLFSLNNEQHDWVVAMQQRDERAKFIVNVLAGRIKSSEEPQLKRDYVVSNHRLYFKKGEEQK